MIVGHLDVSGEASIGFNAVREDEANRRDHHLTPEDSYVLKVYPDNPENPQELSFFCSTQKHGPVELIPKKFDGTIVQECARDLYVCLSQHGRFTSTELATAGKALYDAVIPTEIWDQLKKAVPGAFLNLEISSKLAWIPWELLSYDGEEFFCTRFRMGRLLLRTPREIETISERLAEKHLELDAFIAIGATDAPNEAMKEGTEIEKIFQERGKCAGTNSRLGAKYLRRELMKPYDVLHFIGHGFYNAHDRGKTGWQCWDGKLLSRKDIDQITSKATVPYLIFANACLSAHMGLSSSEGFITSLFHAFFHKGAPHYIGTLAEVPQEQATEFAKVFYRELVRGVSIGEALWKSRLAFFNQPGAPIWPYYVHYGDPADSIFPATLPTESRERTRDETLSPPEPPDRFRLYLGVTVGALALLSVVFFIFLWPSLQARFFAFPKSMFGVAVLDFAIRDSSTGIIQPITYIDAVTLRRRLDGLRLPRRLDLRNLHRVFADRSQAQHFGELTRAQIVVWGYGEKKRESYWPQGTEEHREIVHLHVFVTMILPPELETSLAQTGVVSVGPTPAEFFYYEMQDAIFDIDPNELKTGNSKDVESLFRNVGSRIVSSAGIEVLLTSKNDRGMRSAEDLLFSCIHDYGGDVRDCKHILGIIYILQGRTRSGENLIQEVVDAKAKEPWRGKKEIDWTASVEHGRIAYLKSLPLGLPTADAVIDDVLKQGDQLDSGDRDKRIGSYAVATALLLGNGNLTDAQNSATDLLSEISAIREHVPLESDPLERYEFYARASLGHIFELSGLYDRALSDDDEIAQHTPTFARQDRLRFLAYLGKYRESGDSSWAQKALAEARNSLERAEVLELQGRRGAILTELRAAVARKERDPSELASRLVDEGLRTGNRTLLEEAISICNSTDAHEFLAGRHMGTRRCALIALDASIFLKKENVPVELHHLWGSGDELSLSDEDMGKLLGFFGYLLSRRSTEGDFSLFSKAEDVLPTDNPWEVAAIFGEGYTAARRGDLKEAERVFAQGKISRNGGFLPLAWIYTQTQRLRQAERVLRSQKILTAAVHRGLGLTYYSEGKLSQAITEYLQALHAEDTTSGRERTYLYLAIAALENKDVRSASEHLKSLLKVRQVQLAGGLRVPVVGCAEVFSERFGALGLVWQPQLCQSREFLKQRIVDLQEELHKTPNSVELRDELFLLYEINRFVPPADKTLDYETEAKLLDEAAELDLRDSVNAPGLSRSPARRYIDKAILALEYGRADDARLALWNCVHWYTINTASQATLWFLEITSLLDETYGVSTAPEKYPPFYTPSLFWPRVTIIPLEPSSLNFRSSMQLSSQQ